MIRKTPLYLYYDATTWNKTSIHVTWISWINRLVSRTSSCLRLLFRPRLFDCCFLCAFLRTRKQQTDRQTDRSAFLNSLLARRWTCFFSSKNPPHTITTDVRGTCVCARARNSRVMYCAKYLPLSFPDFPLTQIEEKCGLSRMFSQFSTLIMRN